MSISNLVSANRHRASTPSISVLIPTLNEALHISALLERLIALGVDQIVVCDGGSTDDTRQIIRQFSRVQLISSQPGRGRQITAAAQMAVGDVLWIVHADSQVPDDCVLRIGKILQDPQISLGCFRVRFDRSHPLLSVYSFLSRFESPISTFGDQGFFVRRDDYHQVGGCAEWTLFEDVDLRQKLRQFGKIKKSNAIITTSSRRFFKFGLVRTQVRNIILLSRYFLGQHPDHLASLYYADDTPPGSARRAQKWRREIGVSPAQISE